MNQAENAGLSGVPWKDQVLGQDLETNLRQIKAHEKYAEIAMSLGLSHHTVEQGVEQLIEAVKSLIRELDVNVN